MALLIIKIAIAILLIFVAFLCLRAEKDLHRNLHKDFYRWFSEKYFHGAMGSLAWLFIVVGALVCAAFLSDKDFSISFGTLIGIAIYAVGIFAQNIYPDIVYEKWRQSQKNKMV